MHGGILSVWGEAARSDDEGWQRTDTTITVERVGREVLVSYGNLTLTRTFPNDDLAELYADGLASEVMREQATMAANILRQFADDALAMQAKVEGLR